MAGATTSRPESIPKCLRCIMSRPAVAVCVQCEFALCSACLKAHIVSVDTAEHTFKHLETTPFLPSMQERQASCNFLKDQVLSGSPVNNWSFGVCPPKTYEALVPLRHCGWYINSAVWLFGPVSFPEGSPQCASISLNPTSTPVEWYKGFSLGANSLATHPWSDNDTVIQWKNDLPTPIAVTAAVTAAMLDSGKNTVALYHNRTTMVGGPWAMNGPSRLKELVPVTLAHGDTLWLRSSIVGLSSNQMQLDMQILL
ncbi:hypothetical protein Pelo_14158 [Pelomyxa schiedti]|nr:hypothetical protein Pelo_14158 [Pelomyxa schiedti]